MYAGMLGPWTAALRKAENFLCGLDPDTPEELRSKELVTGTGASELHPSV